jgi:hypothetical protein
VRIRVAALLAIVAATCWFGAVSGPPARAAGPVTWAIVGDSIIGGNVTYIESVLTQSNLPPWHIDGRSARRMVTPVITPRWSASSGLDAIRATRALGHDPKRWVIELGTNDAGSVTNCSCADPIAFADSLIRQLVTEIGSGSQILWVNVRGSTSGVLAINAALAARAKASPSTFQVADWNGYTAGRDAWFVDGVHPTATGAVELGRFIVAAVTALPPVPGTSVPPSTTVSCTVTTSTTVTSTTVAPGSTAPAFTKPASALQRARRCAFR